MSNGGPNNEGTWLVVAVVYAVIIIGFFAFAALTLAVNLLALAESHDQRQGPRGKPPVV